MRLRPRTTLLRHLGSLNTKLSTMGSVISALVMLIILLFTLMLVSTAKHPGFGVTELNNSPTTGVTLNNVQMQVAFPANLITRLTVVQGDYTVSGPTTITIPGAPYNPIRCLHFHLHRAKHRHNFPHKHNLAGL